MKYHFTVGLNHYITKATSLKNCKSLDDLYNGALKAERHIKEASSTHANAHFKMTKPQEGEHEDSFTEMLKPGEMML